MIATHTSAPALLKSARSMIMANRPIMTLLPSTGHLHFHETRDYPVLTTCIMSHSTQTCSFHRDILTVKYSHRNFVSLESCLVLATSPAKPFPSGQDGHIPATPPPSRIIHPTPRKHFSRKPPSLIDIILLDCLFDVWRAEYSVTRS